MRDVKAKDTKEDVKIIEVGLGRVLMDKDLDKVHVVIILQGVDDVGVDIIMDKVTAEIHIIYNDKTDLEDDKVFEERLVKVDEGQVCLKEGRLGEDDGLKEDIVHTKDDRRVIVGVQEEGLKDNEG